VRHDPARRTLLALTYQNLDETTRGYMLGEFEMDAGEGLLFLSSRLTGAGRRRFPELLAEAIRRYDDRWLAAQLIESLLMSGLAPQGHYRIDSRAPENLAEDEFNRYYMRGLCARAQAEGDRPVEVYRGRVVAALRPAILKQIGQRQAPGAMLSALHLAHRTDPGTSSPFGANAGLSIRLATG